MNKEEIQETRKNIFGLCVGQCNWIFIIIHPDHATDRSVTYRYRERICTFSAVKIILEMTNYEAFPSDLI